MEYYISWTPNIIKGRDVLYHALLLRNQIMEENYSDPMAGHFSGEKLYKSLVTQQGMYSNVMSFCMSCLQCAIVNAVSRVNKLPLHPIPFS